MLALQFSRLIYVREYTDFKDLKRQGCHLSRKVAFLMHYRGLLLALFRLIMKKALGRLRRTDYFPSSPPVFLN